MGRRKRFEKTGLVLLGVFCWWGLMETGSIIRPARVLAGAEVSVLSTRSREETCPRPALINGTLWEWNLYRGTDGGWWITPLTGRWTSLPTLFYGFGGKDLIEKVNRRALRLLQARPGEADWWRLIREEGITHIYSRSGAEALLPESLLTCPGLKMEYHRGQVYVFKID